MVEAAPSSVDLQDFQFKLHSKLKIFDNTDDTKFKNATNSVAAASRYGLVFIGTVNKTLEVVQLKTIENSQLSKVETSGFPRRSINLQSVPTHLALNCDQTLLAVVNNKNECTTVTIYNVPSFVSQNVVAVREIRVSATPGVRVLETGWNPAIPQVYTACKSDGSLGVYTVQENSVDINELPVAAAASCFCWSPKGKQIVVGSTNGTLTQYKPDLKAVKAIQAPTLQGTGPFSVVNVFWLTNYQFVAIYKDASNPDVRPSILIVNAPKGAAINFINYDDICYSYGTLRPPQYYIIHQPTWGVLLVASANSMEVGVLGICQSGEPALWQQWNQIDAARAELPLSASHQETFPIGFAFDTGVTLQLPWGENQSLPPMPMIHLISHHGVLCSFSVINIRQGVATICTPPEPIPDQSGFNQFIIPQSAPAITSTPPQNIPAKISTPAPPGGLQFGVPATTTTFAKPTAQPASLFSGTSAPSLFGGIPNFSTTISAVTTVTPTPTFNFKLPATAVSSPSFGSISTPPTPLVPPNTPAAGITPITNTATSIFAASSTPALGATTSAPTLSFGSKPPSFSLPAATSSPSMFGASSLTPKLIAPTTISSSPSISTLFTTPTPKPATQPLLATPKDTILKQPAKIDLATPPQNQSVIQTPSSETALSKKDESVLNDQAIQSLIKDEVKNFKAELQEMFHRCKTINLDVGSEDEKTNLVLTTDSLLDFYKELQDITDSQVAEVHYLKQALMQSFAWYEDTKSRHKRYTDPNFASLLQSQELDPVSEKQLADIQHLIYYIEAQLKQVDSFLDNQWADFQDSCKKHIKGKLHIPTLEPIYQSLIRQNAILEKHRYLLKDIGARIKSRNKKFSNYPNVMNRINQKTDKDNIQIDDELRKLKINHEDIFTVRYEKILTNEKKFSDSKQSKLCSFFTNRNVMHIVPKKPKFTNSLLNISSSKIGLGSSYTVSPTAQKTLTQAFDSLAQNKFDLSMNNSAEANLSASNLFSFTLLDSTQKVKSPEKLTKPPLFNTPKTPEVQTVKTLTSTPSLSTTKPLPTMAFNIGSPQTLNFTSQPGAVFNFTASNTINTQKPQIFTSTQPIVTTNTTFSLGSVSITPVSITSEKDKTSQSKPSSGFTFTMPSVTKPHEVKAIEPQPLIKPTATSKPAEVTLIKPNAVKTTIGGDSNLFGNLSLSENKPGQSFSFTAPQQKATTTTPSTTSTTSLFKVATDNNARRETLEPSFNFGTALSFNQQSTPKPKITSVITQSPITITTVAATTAAPLVTKPAFSLTQPAISTPSTTPVQAQVSATQIPTIVSTAAPTVSTPDSVTPTTSVTSSFGGFAPTTSTTNIFGQPAATATSLPATASIPNIFESATTSTLFGATPTQTSATTTIFGAKTTSIPATSALFAPKDAAPTATVAAITSTPTSTPSTPVTTAATSFSFVQPSAAVVSSPTETAKTTASIFGNVAASPTTPTTLFGNVAASPTTPTTLFGSVPATSSTTSFSFLQPSVTGAAASTVSPKASSEFGAPAENKPSTETTTAAGFGLTTAKTEATSTFGFDSLAVTSAGGDNKFSFGNLTVSALSPSTNTTTTVTTTNTGTFSFALPTATTATSAASGFGNFSNPFGSKSVTTTTASFMGQPVCSPSSFSQNTTGSIFGQAAGNIFAQKPATSNNSNTSIFGQTTGTNNVFGGGTNTPAASGTSIFGQTQSSPFGAPVSSSGSIFGQSSAFGATTIPTTTAATGFGSSFGNAAATSTPSNFSFTQNANSTGFGSSPGNIFGAKSSFGAQPAFGQPTAFGAPPAFGSTPATSGNIFGTPSSPNTSVFGAKPAFGSPPAFGSKPAFGSPPGFGQQNTFAAQSSFGQSATFGTAQSLFGGGGASSPQGTAFGSSAMQENSTFANLANQNTVGFGNLAQNQAPAAPAQPQQFSGSSSFSSWR